VPDCHSFQLGNEVNLGEYVYISLLCELMGIKAWVLDSAQSVVIYINVRF
jgi:hypothetical protein